MLSLLLFALAAEPDLSEPIEDDPAPRFRGAAGTIAAGGAIFAGTVWAVVLEGKDFRFGSAPGYTCDTQLGLVCSTRGTGSFNTVALGFLAAGAGLVVTGLVWMGIEWIVSKVTAKPEHITER